MASSRVKSVLTAFPRGKCQNTCVSSSLRTLESARIQSHARTSPASGNVSWHLAAAFEARETASTSSRGVKVTDVFRTAVLGTIFKVTSTTTPSLPTLARTASKALSPSWYRASVPLARTIVTATVCDEIDPCRRLDPCVAVATAPATVWSMNQGNAASVYPRCVPRNSASPKSKGMGWSSSAVGSSWLARWSRRSLSITPASTVTVMDEVSILTRSATGLSEPQAAPLPARRLLRSLGDAPAPTLRRRWVRMLTLSVSSPAQKSPRCQLCPTPFARTRGNDVTTSETSRGVRGAAMRTLASHACLPWKLLRSWPDVPSSAAAPPSSVHSSANRRGLLWP